MRPAVLEFARDVAASFPVQDPLVELGARAAEGQEDIADLRGIFGAREHIGCDIQAGPGVDRIEDVHALSFADDSVGTVICLETLEHVADPLRAVQEMHRVLRPGGLLAISSLMFFPIHAHPWDFWRFTPEGFELLLRPFESSLVLGQGWELMPEGVFGIGVKGPAELGPERLPRTAQIAREWGRGKHVDLGPMRMSVRELWRFTLRESVKAARRRLDGSTDRRPRP
jgi:SAM-dependent methyltransferase